MTSEPTELAPQVPDMSRPTSPAEARWQVTQLLECSGLGDLHSEPEPESDVSDDWPACVLALAANIPGLLTEQRTVASLDALLEARTPLALRASTGQLAVLDPIGSGRFRWSEYAGDWRGVDREDLPALLGEWPLLCVSAEEATPLEPLANKEPVARAKALLAIEGQDVGVVLIYAACIGILSLVVPVGVQALVNNLGLASVGQPIVVLALLVLLGLVLAGTLRAFQYRVLELFQRRLFARAAADVTLRLTRVDPQTLRNHGGGQFLNRFFDVVTMQKTATALLLEGVAVVLQAAIGLLLLAFYHPVMLAFGLFVGIALALIIFVAGRHAIATAIGESKAKYALAGWLQDLASHPEAYGGEGGDRIALAKTDALLAKWMSYRSKHFQVVFRQVVSGYALQAIAASALLGVGGWLVLQRQLSLGQLVAAELVVAGVLSGMSKLGKLVENYYDLIASSDKVGQLIDLPALGLSGRSLAGGAASIELRHFAINTRPGHSVAPLNLTLNPGDQVSVTGDTHASSVLLQTIGSERPAKEGVFCIGQLDVRSLRARALRTAVAYIGKIQGQAGSVRELLRGTSTATDEALRDALRAVDLDEAVLALQEGLSTNVTSAAFTEAEEKRLAIARALVSSPTVLLLDHTLDALPAALAQKILTALKTRRLTLIVATARDEIAKQLPRRLSISADGIREVA